MDTYFETKLTYNQISFQRSDSPTISEREIHSYHEILFCEALDAVLFTDKQQRNVRGDMLFLIPQETYHFFRPQNCRRFSRLKIAFPADVLDRTPCGQIMSELRIIENLDTHILFLLKRLCRIMEEPDNSKQGFYAYSTALMLLAELDRYVLDSESAQDPVETGEMHDITRYIAQHLSDDLTVDALAKRMSISPSGITHLFKKELGISVHQYVTQRRLIFAQSLLKAGKKPSKIYTDCGYKDYSSFYKAYIQFFGYPPSSEEKG